LGKVAEYKSEAVVRDSGVVGCPELFDHHDLNLIFVGFI